MKKFRFAALMRGLSFRSRSGAAGPSLLPALARRTIFRPTTCLRVGACATIGVGALLPLSGCEKGPKTAMAYVLDPTDSSAKGRQEFRKDFQKVITGGFLGKSAEIAIVRSDKNPALLFGGSARQMQRINAALVQAEKPAPAMSGSNPAQALAVAQTWLNNPKFKGWRHVVVIYSDIVPDADQSGAKPINFADPLKFQFSPDTEVHLYGLPFARHAKVRAAWKGLKTAPDLHQPHESLSPQQDLGLHSSAL